MGGGAVPQPRRSIVTGQSANDDDAEIAQYYANWHGRVHLYLVLGCGCPDADAEDIVQDTIMVIRERHWQTVRAYAKPEAYWFTIAGRRYRRIRREQAGRFADVDPSDALHEAASYGDPYAQADLRQALEPLLSQLPPRQRQVLWLREAADFSTADTAKILSISPGSVKKHLNIAKDRMRKLLSTDSATWEEAR
jgi:RNA polymerase sigma-70 factor (ECF subfamily)